MRTTLTNRRPRPTSDDVRFTRFSSHDYWRCRWYLSFGRTTCGCTAAANTKSDVQSMLRHFFTNCHNRPPSAVNVMKASTGGIIYTSDVVWTVSRASVLLSPARRSQGNYYTMPRRDRRCSTSATCRHHQRFGRQSHSHCRRRSSLCRHHFNRLRGHRHLPLSPCRYRTRSRSRYPAVPARRR